MDAYQKLRPWTDIEACECSSIPGLLLVDLLTDNPLHCSYCRREVDPERLALTVQEPESVAQWFGAASALYRLWLHSGDYEEYAKRQLLDPHGQINVEGVRLAATVAEHLQESPTLPQSDTREFADEVIALSNDVLKVNPNTFMALEAKAKALTVLAERLETDPQRKAALMNEVKEPEQ